MFKERLNKFQNFMKSNNLDAFLIPQRAELKHVANVRYLCGFAGDTGLMVITQKEACLIVDSRFHTQAKKEAKGVRKILAKMRPVMELKEMKQLKIKNMRFGYDPDSFTVTDLNAIRANLPDALLIETPDAVGNLTIIKEKYEIEMIEKSIQIAETALERIFGYIRPGLREIEVAAELEYQMRMLGAEGPAFDTIVASGHRSALPHGLASTRKIARNDFVTIDYGASYKGYISDITRTFVVGKANARQKKIYNIVLKANKAGIRKVKPGIGAAAVDAAARNVIKKAGYGRYFGHGLGHGIGIYVHVGPRLGPRTKDTLKKGMVLTIEPGIYIPDWGGVRIEDDVLVTKTGCKVLTSAPKKLLEV